MNENNPLPFKRVTTTRDFRMFLRTPPTFPEALAFLRQTYGDSLSESLVREWYDYMQACCWSDPKGNPYMNWPRCFYVWKVNYARYKAMHSVPVQGGNFKRQPPRADNYIRASDAEIERFRNGFI